MRMAKGLSPVRRALVGGLLLAAVALPVQCRVGSEISDDSTSKLFNEPYRPDESRHYDADSSTFSADAGRQFDLSYADGTVLRGFNGEDVVQLGDFHGMAPFGVITECNSPDFNGVDGILGFGLPKPGYEGRTLPTPILFALTEKGIADSNAQELQRKFSFFSTDDKAEVQLGGYDPATCDDEMDYTPSLSPTDFIVGVTSLKFGHPGSEGHQELLKFNDPTGGEYLPAIMDSGTSCLVIPGSRLGGKLDNVPFDDFTNAWDEGTSFYVTIGGKTFEIPYHSWFLAATSQTCVQPSPDGMEGLLIGDVFFREYVVEFDMVDEERPIIGIARLNKSYQPVATGELGYFHLSQAPRSKLHLLRGEETMYPAEHSRRLDEVDQIPIFNKKGTQYFMDVQVGTPRQKFTVIFDTGSAVFGVFTLRDRLPEDIKQTLSRSSAFKIRVDSMQALMSWDFGSNAPAREVDLSAAHSRTATALAMASADLRPAGAAGGVAGWGPSAGGALLLVAVVANVLAGLHLARRRAQRTVTVDMAGVYGTVPVVAVQGV